MATRGIYRRLQRLRDFLFRLLAVRAASHFDTETAKKLGLRSKDSRDD